MLLAVPLALAGLAVLPVWAQVPREIAYLGAGGSVWLMDVESGEGMQLADVQEFTALDWAPDGQRLVLLKGGPIFEGGHEIYVLDADGSDLTKVAEGYAPVWYSDSRRILYVSNYTPSEQGAEQSLRVVNLAEGTDVTLATRLWVSGLWPVERAQHSSDERLIAVYVAGLEMEGHIVVVNDEGRVVWEIPGFVYSADSFAWAPDSQQLAYRDSGEPFMGGEDPSWKIVRADAQEVIHTLNQAGFWPRWSPDGKRIAALLWEEGGGFSVMMVDPLSGELLLQTDRVSGELWNSRPNWSPDSSSLLFTSSEDGQTRVYVLDHGGAPRSVAEGQYADATWALDGSLIVMAAGEEGAREISLVAADGSGVSKVGDGWMPRWRPGA